jgi:hypothetical protein
MVDERRPTKKVVKKVVRKTVVVRPPQTGSTKVRSAPAPTGATPLAKLKAKAAAGSRPTLRIPSPPRRPGAGLAGRARLAGSRVGDRARGARDATGEALGRGFDFVRGLRLPHVSPLRGAAITGILVGLLAVALGWSSYLLFSATRGTTAGGGWGALVLVVVAFLAFAAGELLLDGFGIEHGRSISAMAIMLVLTLLLMFSSLLNLAAGPGAWILIPALSMIMFMVSSRVMQFAADQPNPR